MIQQKNNSRILNLNKTKTERIINKNCVIYVMSRDQRVFDNHSLAEALDRANENNLPLIVVFILYPSIKNRSINQFFWMIEGLKQVEKKLNKLGVKFIVKAGKFSEVIHLVNNELKPESIYFDFSPLRGPQKVKLDFAIGADVGCYVVDTHNIVPVWEASNKEEIGARTLRPKIVKKLNLFFVEPDSNYIVINKSEVYFNDWDNLTKSVSGNFINNYKPTLPTGEDFALRVLSEFIENKINDYGELRNDPSNNFLSDLSPYLHFGQISSLRIALEINKKIPNVIEDFKKISLGVVKKENFNSIKQSVYSFFDELIIRKELSDNFCFYNKNYDSLDGIKPWAIETLKNHQTDIRENIYTFKQLENAETHDEAWNSAQIQMKTTGKMHGYMRMYWAKKILEWSKTPEEALTSAIKLNDLYELDGYDPNGYVGCMWSIGGIHDRGWTERSIFGKIRFMNFNGLKRKFNIEKYIKDWLNPSLFKK